MTFQVFTMSNVGSNEKPIAGAVAESTHASFDAAYDAALAVGGNRMVCPLLGARWGSCEFVEVQS